MREGWFAIPGVQKGPRTLEEQMRGLEPALAEARDRVVLDLGCAEGLIAIEFAKAGAREVVGIECNQEAAEVAERLTKPYPCVRIVRGNLNPVISTAPAGGEGWRYDTVLALAILHKLADPAKAARWVADCTARRLVVRLPFGSEGVISGKHTGRMCDVREHFAASGLQLEQVLEGPRGELVQHWVRA